MYYIYKVVYKALMVQNAGTRACARIVGMQAQNDDLVHGSLVILYSE